MGDEFSLEDAIIVLQRRFILFLLPILVIAPIVVVVVMALPAKYTAEGTILVESQQIPTDLIRSTINAYAQERIQTIRQRVMTRNRLLEVADKYALFPGTKRLSESARVQKMRSRLNVQLITTSANRVSSRDGTIAFTVSYTDPSAEKAFLVANEFMTLFLSEDVRARTTGASNTTEFFEREASRLRTAVADLENRISEYKTANGNALPEHLNLHLDMLERATRDLNSTQASIGTLEEQLRFLESQLLSGGSGDDQPAQELSRLQSELARLRGIYRDRHPSIQTLQSEIAAMKRQLLPSQEIRDLRNALADAESKFSTLERDADADPEAVATAEEEVIAAREALSEKIKLEARRGANDPQGVQLEGRIAVISNRIRMLEAQREQTREEMADLQGRIAKTPEVERGLSALSRDHENIFREYQDVLAKQQDAQLAENLEENQQAEKFSILEPALRPDKPSSPDRLKLIILGLFAAIGAGGLAAIAAELFFSTIRGRNHLSHLIDGHPIAIVPYIHTAEDRRFKLPFLGRPKLQTAPTPETI